MKLNLAWIPIAGIALVPLGARTVLVAADMVAAPGGNRSAGGGMGISEARESAGMRFSRLAAQDQPVPARVARLATPPPPGERISFSMVTIRPDQSGRATSRFEVMTDAPPHRGRLAAEGVTVAELIGWAYAISDLQSLGGPGWIHRDRLDVNATFDVMVSTRGLKSMMQRVLVERFGLALRTVQRDAPIYSMVLAAPDGPRGAHVEAASTCPDRDLPRRIAPPGAVGGSGSCVSLGFMASVAADWLGVPVIDDTGVSGRYNAWVYWAPEPGAVTIEPLLPGRPVEKVDAPPFHEAFEQHVGLRLVATRGLADVLEVVAVEAPTFD